MNERLTIIEKSPAVDLGGAKVLVGEDEFFVAIDIAEQIEDQNGVVVGPVTTVVDALRYVEDGQVDGAILDFNLLDGDVTQLVGTLKRQNKPAVVHTGAPLPVPLQDAFPDVPVIPKPVPPTTLISELARGFACGLGGPAKPSE